jgi:predicted dehydrogenase
VDPVTDAVLTATPAAMHFKMTRAGLCAGKHALVKKPLAGTSDQSCSPIEDVAWHGRVLMVGHTFVYTSAIQTID